MPKYTQKIINFDNLIENKIYKIIEKQPSKRKIKDKTGTRGKHIFIKKGYFKKKPKGQNLYIELRDEKKQLWRLEFIFAGESGRNGLFPWYDPEKRPINWNTEFIIKGKPEPKPEKKIINNKGRWHKEEIKIFDLQFSKFKKEWTKYKIHYNGGIRTSSQIRSFAQKYIKKLNKNNSTYTIYNGAKALIFFIKNSF
jgi:hypothetical protein